MQKPVVEPIARRTPRARNSEELEALRHRKGKHNKTARGRTEWEAA